jgi:hypothetical protein
VVEVLEAQTEIQSTRVLQEPESLPAPDRIGCESAEFPHS